MESACRFSTQKPGMVFGHKPPEAAFRSPEHKNASLRDTVFSQPLCPVPLVCLCPGEIGPLPLSPCQAAMSMIAADTVTVALNCLLIHTSVPAFYILGLSEKMPVFAEMGVWCSEKLLFYTFFLFV